MAQIKIQCPKCCVKLVVNYRTSGYGHGATDEALAIHDAIKDHLCKSDPERQA